MNGPSMNTKVSVSSNSSELSSAESMSTLKTIAQEAINRAGLENITSNKLPDTRQQIFLDSTSTTNSTTNGPNLNNMSLIKSTGTNEAHIPPLLGVAPLGPSPLQKEHQLQFQMMEAAYYHLPSPSDSERLRNYLQRQPVQTPAYYPQVITFFFSIHFP